MWARLFIPLSISSEGSEAAVKGLTQTKAGRFIYDLDSIQTNGGRCRLERERDRDADQADQKH